MHNLQYCLRYIDDYGYSKCWAVTRNIEPDDDLTTMTPQLLIRQDATQRQLNSISQLFSMNALSVQLTYEIGPERMLYTFMKNILDDGSGFEAMVPLQE